MYTNRYENLMGSLEVFFFFFNMMFTDMYVCLGHIFILFALYELRKCFVILVL